MDFSQTTLIGIDLSKTSTGFARIALTEDQISFCETKRIQLPKGLAKSKFGPAQSEYTSDKIASYLDALPKEQYKTIILEAPIYQGLAALNQYALFQKVLETISKRKNLNIMCLTPMSVKGFARHSTDTKPSGGKTTLQKKDMQRAMLALTEANTEMQHLWVDSYSDDQVDAMWIALAGSLFHQILKSPEWYKADFFLDVLEDRKDYFQLRLNEFLSTHPLIFKSNLGSHIQTFAQMSLNTAKSHKKNEAMGFGHPYFFPLYWLSEMNAWLETVEVREDITKALFLGLKKDLVHPLQAMLSKNGLQLINPRIEV